MPELTITSPYVHSRVDSNTFTMGNPMPEPTLTLCQSQLYPPVRDFGFSFKTTWLRICKSFSQRDARITCRINLSTSSYQYMNHKKYSEFRHITKINWHVVEINKDILLELYSRASKNFKKITAPSLIQDVISLFYLNKFFRILVFLINTIFNFSQLFHCFISILNQFLLVFL